MTREDTHHTLFKSGENSGIYYYASNEVIFTKRNRFTEKSNVGQPDQTWCNLDRGFFRREKGREASSHVMCRVFSTCTEARAHPHGSDPPAASPGVRTGHFTNDQNTTREPESDALPKI